MTWKCCLLTFYRTPIAFERIGWKFYLCFIIPGILSGIAIWIFFPDTKGLALEEVAALFGDQDEMVSHTLDAEIEKEMKLDHIEVEHKAVQV